MMILKHILLTTSVLSLIVFSSNAQVCTEIYGDTVYTKGFTNTANDVGFEDILNSRDSIIIRVWNGGNSYSISYLNDTIIGEKLVYVYRNPSLYHREKHEWTTIYETNKLNYSECLYVFNQFKYYQPDFLKYKINTDSIKRRDGGNPYAIEFKVGKKYLILTGELFTEKEQSFLDSTTNCLKLEELEDTFKRKLPNGYWYNSGGTTSIYRMSFFQGLIHRFSFWKRF